MDERIELTVWIKEEMEKGNRVKAGKLNRVWSRMQYRSSKYWEKHQFECPY